MQYTITEHESDQRFDRFLRKLFKENKEIKLWEIYKMIRKWVIKVNQKKQKDSYRLKIWDIITITESIKNKTKEEKISNFPIEKIENMVIQEDDNFIFFNKPAWITIHEWNKHMEDLTMNSFLKKYIKNKGIAQSATFSPAFCYRLDKDTSWILIAWKNYDSLKTLNELIRNHKTNKKYLAIVIWKPKDQDIKQNLKKIYDKKFWKAKVIQAKDWDFAQTNIKVLKTINDDFLWEISLIQATLLTWRMHQIRVHLSEIKHPIIWDLMYSNPVINRLAKKKYKILRQLLHCVEYSFEYQWKKYNIHCKMPWDFEKVF